MKETILKAAENSDLIFITGGLGPTKDDKTKEAFAEALNLKLNFSEAIEKKLKNIFSDSDHKNKMSKNNLSQAYIPSGAEIINNDRGTAPAIKLEKENQRFYLLPGVPSELKYIFREKIVRELKSLNKNSIFVREFNFIGIGESTLAAKIDKLKFDSNLKLSYQAGKAEVKLRLTINNGHLSNKFKKRIMRKAVKNIKENFKDYLYGEGKQKLIDKLHSLLIEKNITVATAESFTGGLLAARLTEKAGSSQYFKGSVVAYNNSIKKKVLNIKDDLLKNYGVVSQECVNSMAKNIAELFSAELAIATTGAAGPDSHGGEKAGTMFIAVLYKDQLKTFRLCKNYGRKKNRFYASQFALFEVYKLLQESG